MLWDTNQRVDWLLQCRIDEEQYSDPHSAPLASQYAYSQGSLSVLVCSSFSVDEVVIDEKYHPSCLGWSDFAVERPTEERMKDLRPEEQLM